MNPLLIYSIVYISALLFTSCLGFPLQSHSQSQTMMLAGLLLGAGFAFAILFPKYWKQALVSGIIAGLAVGYMHVCIPRPSSNDVSNLLSSSNQVPVQVTGVTKSWLKTSPSGRKNFWISVQSADNAYSTGNLYVTIKQEKSILIHPGQVVQIQGLLRKPTKTDDGFDFAEYLAKEGAFASLGARSVTLIEDKGFWWRFQQRVMSAFEVVGHPNAEIISAFAIGNRPIDIPKKISDAFAIAGLSHALAASGTQVSLLLFAVLALTSRFGKWVQIGIGIISVSILVILCSPSASIVRAALMGAVSLLALSQGNRKRSLSSLVGIATILLIQNPCQIWDLGFDFSFLATLGLIVTAGKLSSSMDFLPPAISAAIAVPVAATIWTLPVQILVFKQIPVYGILANLLAEPLVWLLSLGSIAGAFMSLIRPVVGGMFAIALNPACSSLLWIVDLVSHLPGAVIKLESSSLLGFVIMYVLLGASHFHVKRWYFWLLAFAGTVLVSAMA